MAFEIWSQRRGAPTVSGSIDPNDFIITKKRKKYRFALFANSPLCFEAEEWTEKPKVDVLEVGAGTAMFSAALAKYLPETQFAAVDVKADRLQTGARIAEGEGLSNIRFLRARADLLNDFFTAGSLDTAWITFPDPFPKERSEKHRLTHPKFLDIYKNLLKPEGKICFKTDARPLFDWSLEQLVAGGWTIEELSFDLHNSELSNTYKIMTTYETRFVNEGLPIYFVSCTPPKHT
jgi:tRNA (guanine-N7-)-methyltransferase